MLRKYGKRPVVINQAVDKQGSEAVRQLDQARQPRWCPFPCSAEGFRTAIAGLEQDSIAFE
jgi:hypothetical protein